VVTVTVVVRWGPYLTLRCGTWVARIGRITTDGKSGPVVAPQAATLIAKWSGPTMAP
jgi:hypothetical protein